MTSIVLNDESSQLSISEILATSSGPLIEILSADGAVVAEIVVHQRAKSAASDAAIEWAEAHLDEWRRRDAADRSKDVTTAELLKLAEQAVARQTP